MKYVARAKNAGISLLTSREKNHTPGTPFRFTYVRTFTSGNDPKYGTGGMKGNEMLRIENGMRPTQALPSNVSTSIPSGRSACTTFGSYFQ
jgi:hypothetical protein